MDTCSSFKQTCMNKENIPLPLAPLTRQKSWRAQWEPYMPYSHLWTNEALKVTMDVVERGVISMRKTNKHWDIPLSSLSNHLNGKTKCRKVGLLGVPTKENDVIVVAWIANMQKHRLSISLQQFKFKVGKFIQGQPTPFQNGLLENL